MSRGTAKRTLPCDAHLGPPLLPSPPSPCSTNIEKNQAKNSPHPGRSWQRLPTGPDPAVSRSKVLQGWEPRRPKVSSDLPAFPLPENGKAKQRVAGSRAHLGFPITRETIRLASGRQSSALSATPKSSSPLGVQGKLSGGGGESPLDENRLGCDIPSFCALRKPVSPRPADAERKREPKGGWGLGFLPLTCFAAAPAAPTPGPSSTAEPERETRPSRASSLQIQK